MIGVKRRFSLLLALLLLCFAPAARADVVFTTGNVNLREGPGLDYTIVTAVPADFALYFDGDDESISTDAGGVDWYYVYYRDFEGWISSKDAVREAATPDPLEGMEPDLNYDPAKSAGYLEVADWYGKPLAEAAEALGLSERGVTDGESPVYYRNGALLISGWDVLEDVELTGQGYTVYGVCPGMELSAAKAVLDASPGLEFAEEDDDGICYNHIKDETAVFEYDLESDYMVSVEANGDGIVTDVWFSTYTG